MTMPTKEEFKKYDTYRRVFPSLHALATEISTTTRFGYFDIMSMCLAFPDFPEEIRKLKNDMGTSDAVYIASLVVKMKAKYK